MLAISRSVHQPPGYRFRDKLNPASAADRIYNPQAVINCNKLNAREQADLCKQRMSALTGILERYKTRGNGLPEIIELLECEIQRERSWHELLIHRSVRPTKNKRVTLSSNYQGLVNSPVVAINDIGRTAKGVFYLLYASQRARPECSFVSSTKLLLALKETQLADIGGSIDVRRVWLYSKEYLGIEFDSVDGSDGDPTRSPITRQLPIDRVLTDLTAWNNARYGVIPPASCDSTGKEAQPVRRAAILHQIWLRSQVWSALMDRGLTAFIAEDDGELFFRVYRHKHFLGAICVDGLGIISTTSSVKGAISEVAADAADAVRALERVASPVPAKDCLPQTITIAEWETLKQIAKGGTDGQILTTDETLAIALDPKYLRPTKPGEPISPRFILRQHYDEIRCRLEDAANRKVASTAPASSPDNFWDYAAHHFDRHDRSELDRLFALYPCEASRLERAYETVKKHQGLKLGNLVVQPFSVCVLDAQSNPLARLSIKSFSRRWQIQRVVSGHFSPFADVESLEATIADLLRNTDRLEHKQLALL